MTDSYAVAKATVPAWVSGVAHLAIVQSEALALMELHGLDDWSFKWDRAVNRSGQCNHTTRTLSFSKPNMQGWTLDNCRLTILHEIAHALTPGHGHDYTWQRKCREIGGDGKRQWAPSADRPQAPKPIVGTCPRGHEYPRSRAPKRGAIYQCPRDNGLITWTRRSA